MNHELIISIIPFAVGVVFGFAAGFATAGMFIQRKLAAFEKKSWAAAMRYYAAKQLEQLNQ